MIHIRNHYISIMVVYAITLHLVWAFILLFDDAATNATAVHALFRYIHPTLFLSYVIGAAAFAALLALFSEKPWIVILLLPQQILLMMSAAGAIEAIWLAQFADGVIRPRAFIAADQFYSILAAVGHTAAITFHALGSDRIK